MDCAKVIHYLNEVARHAKRAEDMVHDLNTGVQFHIALEVIEAQVAHIRAEVRRAPSSR
jgi:hypothetical protein